MALIALRLGSGFCLCESPIRIGGQGPSPNASAPRPAYKTAVAGRGGAGVSHSAEPTPDPRRSRRGGIPGAIGEPGLAQGQANTLASCLLYGPVAFLTAKIPSKRHRRCKKLVPGGSPSVAWAVELGAPRARSPRSLRVSTRGVSTQSVSTSKRKYRPCGHMKDPLVRIYWRRSSVEPRSSGRASAAIRRRV